MNISIYFRLYIKNKLRPTFSLLRLRLRPSSAIDPNCYGCYCPHQPCHERSTFWLFFLRFFFNPFFPLKIYPWGWVNFQPLLKCTKRAIFCISKLGWWQGFGANDNGWRREVASALAAPPELTPDQSRKKNWAAHWTELEKSPKHTMRAPSRPELEKIELPIGQSWRNSPKSTTGAPPGPGSEKNLAQGWKKVSKRHHQSFPRTRVRKKKLSSSLH